MEDVRWIVAYNDGTFLEQFDKDGKENLFKDIDQDKLLEFSLLTPDYSISVFPKDSKYGIFSRISNSVIESRLGITFKFDSLNSDCKLSYFIRHKITIDNIDEKQYFVGLQSNDIVRYIKYSNGELSVADSK